LRGLRGGAEGIRNDGHRSFRPVEEHGRDVLTVLEHLEIKHAKGGFRSVLELAGFRQPETVFGLRDERGDFVPHSPSI
jgi:hypothetical protein